MWKLLMSVIVISAMALILGLSPLAAHSLTLDAVSGTWSNLVGGTNINYSTNAITYGNNNENQVHWGNDFGSGQSGLGFIGVSPPTTSFAPETAFNLGQLRHFNNPIIAWSAASSVDLIVTTDFGLPDISPSFTFSFTINETLNKTGDPYLDRDFIFFPSNFSTETFNIDGTIYTLKLLGLGPDDASLVSRFETNEGGINSTLLWGKITTETVVAPIPGAALLLGSGLLLLAAFGRRNED